MANNNTNEKKTILADYRAFQFPNYSKHLLPSHNFNANWNLYLFVYEQSY